MACLSIHMIRCLTTLSVTIKKSKQLYWKMYSEDLYLNRAKFVMKLLGVWVPPFNEKTLHKWYRIFMMMLQYLFLIFQIIYIIQVWGDLEAVSQASYLLFTQACLCLKVTVFQLNVSMVRNLLERMNGDVFKPFFEEHER